MARSESGAVPERPHHISTIAHLFLQDDPAQGDTTPAVCNRDIAVAAPGVSPVTAFAAVGLALGSNRLVTLSENKEIRWSARTFLPRDQKDAGIHSGPPDLTCDTWKIGPRSIPAGEALPSVDASGLQWSHLGCLGEAGLAHLESLAAARSLVEVPLAGSGGLVWCLLEQEASRLGPSYILGRLVEQIRPGKVEILLFPDAWDNAGRPGWLEEICRNDSSAEDSASMKRCAWLATLACGGISLKVNRVVGSDNLARSFEGDGKMESIWQRIALSMIAGGLEG
jgi:hypothetical protein